MPGFRFAVSNGGVRELFTFYEGNYITWMDTLYQYGQNTEIFACPDALPVRFLVEEDCHYGYNANVGGGNFGGMGFERPPLKTADFKQPSASVLSMDYASMWGLYANPGEYKRWILRQNHSPTTPDPMIKAMAECVAPHADSTNFLYADGHVKIEHKLDAIDMPVRPTWLVKLDPNP